MAGDQQDDGLNAFLSPLIADTNRLYLLAVQFSSTYRQLAWDSPEQFLPTPITSLPTGKETGRFLAIDVGGTNLRVGFIELHGSATSTTSSKHTSNLQNGPSMARNGAYDPTISPISRKFEKSWPIGEHLKMDKAEDLFTWVGDCIAEVVRDRVESEIDANSPDEFSADQELAMGITFSFPMIQTSLAEATLMPMGKGFAITSNLNLGKLLLAGYERHTEHASTNRDSTLRLGARTREIVALPRLNIAAITNDTVATLASLAYRAKSLPKRRVAMGLIVGTGTNATILLKLSQLSPSKRASIEVPLEAKEANVKVVVNTEWTIKGTAPPLHQLNFITKWDAVLDEASEAPGFQPFEYMTAGRYLGEIVRLITLDVFVNQLRWEKEDLPELIQQRNMLTTTFLAVTVAGPRSNKALVLQFEKCFPCPRNSKWAWSDEAISVIRQIARLVQVRSARLIAAAIIGLLACAGEIQFEGSDGDSAIMSEVPGPRNGGNECFERSERECSEELIVAYTGGTICNYPLFLYDCQQCLDELSVMSSGQKATKRTIILSEARDGGIIGAGVLASTAYLERKH